MPTHSRDITPSNIGQRLRRRSFLWQGCSTWVCYMLMKEGLSLPTSLCHQILQSERDPDTPKLSVRCCWNTVPWLLRSVVYNALYTGGMLSYIIGLFVERVDSGLCISGWISTVWIDIDHTRHGFQWVLPSRVCDKTGIWQDWCVTGLVCDSTGWWQDWCVTGLVGDITGWWQDWWVAGLVCDRPGGWQDWCVAGLPLWLL